jgi:hypothetical protein
MRIAENMMSRPDSLKRVWMPNLRLFAQTQLRHGMGLLFAGPERVAFRQAKDDETLQTPIHGLS